MNNQVLYIDLWRTYLTISLIVIHPPGDKGELTSERFSLSLKFQKKDAKISPSRHFLLTLIGMSYDSKKNVHL